MSRKPLTIGNQLEFLKIEEALKKNSASERLRVFLQRKMHERAEIELKNITLLQQWLDDLEDPREKHALDGSDSYLLESQMIRTLIGTLKDDAIAFINERQTAYNAIMAKEGPHSTLQRSVLRNPDSTKNIYNISEEFGKINEKRKRIESDYVKGMEYKEHATNQVLELEEKLAKRSRITSKRRPVSRNGFRNIDALNQRLSMLRQSLDRENQKMDELKEEVNDLESSTAKTLEDIDKELQQLETGRIKIIALQTKLFVQRLNGGRRVTPQERVTGIPKFALFNIDHMEKTMKDHWSDVASNARISQSGAQFRVRDFFCVERPKSHHQGSDGADDTGSSLRTASSSHSTGKYGQLDLRKVYDKMLNQDPRTAASDPVTGTKINGGTSSASGNNKARRKVLRRRKEPGAVDSSSSTSGNHVSSMSSVESLLLPPEVRCPAEVTSADPNRQFQNLFSKLKRPFSRNNREHTPVVPYACDSVDSDMSSESLGRLTNVKVIVIQEYATRRTGELTLKKGQIIKQKAAADDDGFCYGWMKDSKLSTKRYGHYPIFAVQFYKRCKPKSQRDKKPQIP